MALSDSVSAVTAIFRNRPGDFLPFYLLGAAVPAIVRVIPFAAILVGYLYLEATGRLEGLPEQLAGIETTPPDPDASDAEVEAWAEQFVPIVEQFVTLPTIALFLAAVVISLLVLFVLYAVVAAGQLATCAARVRDERGVVAGIAGVRRYGLRFLALFLLEFLLWTIAIATVGILAVIGSIVVAAASPLFAILVAFLAGLVLLAVLAVIRALFAFAPVAVVVDDAGVFASLSKTAGFVRARPIGAAFYYVMSVGTLLAISTVSGVLVLVEIFTLVSLVTIIVVLPVLDALKTALYTQYRGRLTPPASPERSVRAQIRAGIGRGWREMVAFVRETPGTHAAVVALALGSFWVGWELAGPYAEYIDASIDARLEGIIPPAFALELFGNNTMVAITTAFSGVALAIPALASLLFNGVYMGAVSRFEVDPTQLLAFVIPHGVFEIPAIFVASALGIWLGVVSWRAFRGSIDRPTFADALERAFWVLVGVALLLAVAGFVEGFVSPFYFRLFL
ncbi:stage II sporulation protein M [Natrarchaeobius chitinivorans]|uniref:Stage II sporulation protein M n=1 Tax=Natrarchaeobius chitinivorans TaxID=1679083 RepID=A0A3N6MPL1_NATCH|nr:stage II sporulation protein M [Natrarchaeobius chitinivorans]RQG96456.1 stage II sporulation protein M [Natrarchaeobius chitinivorans]